MAFRFDQTSGSVLKMVCELMNKHGKLVKSWLTLAQVVRQGVAFPFSGMRRISV